MLRFYGILLPASSSVYCVHRLLLLYNQATSTYKLVLVERVHVEQAGWISRPDYLHAFVPIAHVSLDLSNIQFNLFSLISRRGSYQGSTGTHRNMTSAY